MESSPTNKQCTKCNEVKPIELFKIKNRKKVDGTVYKYVQSICKKCTNVQRHIRRKLKRKMLPARIPSKFISQTDRTKKLIDRNRKYIKDFLCNNCCKDCGHGDWRVLEFDHLPEYSKHKNVCDMMQFSIKKLQEEIDKCEVVCSNCHSLRSFKRGNSWRML